MENILSPFSGINFKKQKMGPEFRKIKTSFSHELFVFFRQILQKTSNFEEKNLN